MQTQVKPLPLILVVDNNKEITTLYSDSLKGMAEVVTVDSVESAMKAFAENRRFDLIVMDDLAGERGREPKTFELTKMFREVYSGPIIITSVLYEAELFASAGGGLKNTHSSTKFKLVQKVKDILNP